MKLKHKIITKMIQSKLTKTEVDFLIYLAKYQEDDGQVLGIYYKNVKEELGISIQKFYDLKKSLIKKGFVLANKGHYTDWNIRIIDNDFDFHFEQENENPKQKNEPYLNMNLKLFSNTDFKKLKAGEKLLALEFLRMAAASRYRYSVKIGMNEFYKKYKALFRVQKRVLQDYLTSLRKFFSISLKDRIYYITPLKDTKMKTQKLEVQTHDKFAMEVFCRRHKIDGQTKETLNTFALLRQYGKQGITFNNLLIAIMKSWKYLNCATEDIKKWTNELRPDLIHKILRTDMMQA